MTGFNDEANFTDIINGMTFEKDTSGGLTIKIAGSNSGPTLKFSLSNYTTDSLSEKVKTSAFKDVLELYTASDASTSGATINLYGVYNHLSDTTSINGSSLTANSDYTIAD